VTRSYAPAARPRVLVQGLTDEEVDSIRPLVGSLDSRTFDESFHGDEYDILIAAGQEFYYGEREVERRIIFADPPAADGIAVGAMSSRDWKAPTSLAGTQWTPANNFVYGDFTDYPGFHGLVSTSCVPEQGAVYRGLPRQVQPLRSFSPFLQEDLATPHVLAGHLTGSEEEDWNDSVLWLPDQARSHLKDWVATACAFWRADAPDRFPVNVEWVSDDQWASAEEQSARAALQAHIDAEQTRRADATRAEDSLRSALDATRVGGETWRELVTATGDELVAAVTAALETLGFEVIDSDALPQHKAAKREDLRIKDGAWVALAEVKGYSGAAKSRDLMQIASARATYALEEQEFPEALWYIVNTYRGEDPGTRDEVLPGREDDIATFADDLAGLVIDSRALFALRQAVTTGTLTAEDARASLRTATGRYSFTA
jgi:hypothetical protein